MSEEKVNFKKSDKPTMFNPAFIDDYGFTPEEFRVFARVMRRCIGERSEGFFESIPTLAEKLIISEVLVRRALKVLEACNALSRQVRPGKSDLFDFNICDQWLPSADLPAIRAQLFGQAVEKDRDRKKDKPVVEITGVGNDTSSGNDTGRGSGNDTPVVSETPDEGISPQGHPPKDTQDVCVREPKETKIFIPRPLPRKTLGSGQPLSDDDALAVNAAFGPYRDELEDWYCRKLNIVQLPPNIETAEQVTWLFENKFTLADIQGFYEFATTDPDERRWRRGNVTLGAIVKGIAGWKAERNARAEELTGAKKPQDCDGCRSTGGMIEIPTADGTRWVACKHETTALAA